MVTKEIQTKKKTSIWKKEDRRRKTLLTKTHFSGETMIQRKKKQRNKLFYIQQQKRKEFSEWNGIYWLNYSSRKTLGRSSLLFRIEFKIEFLNHSACFSERNSDQRRCSISILQEFRSDFYVGKTAGFAYWFGFF